MKRSAKKKKEENIWFWITFLAVLYFLFWLLQVIVLIFWEGWIFWDWSAWEVISRTLWILVWCFMMGIAWGLYTKKTWAWWTATLLIVLSLIISLIIVVFFLTLSPILFIIIDGLLLWALWRHKDIYEIDTSSLTW